MRRKSISPSLRLGSYEEDKFKDISHYAFILLAKFYEVFVDYLLGHSETKNHSNTDLADLHLSGWLIEFLKSGLVDNTLLCELATHLDLPRFKADLEIHVIQQDMNRIALDLQEAPKDGFFSVAEDNPLENFLQTAEKTATTDSGPKQAAMAFICNRLKVNYEKMSEDKKRCLKSITENSDLQKNEYLKSISIKRIFILSILLYIL